MAKVHCKRCGTCCIKGGPVLHHDDLDLLNRGVIRPDQLVVIREAEPAYNPASDAIEPASCEMLKIQGKPGSWECLFYDPDQKSCSIHADRPQECRLLQCQAPDALLAIMGKKCLNRRDLIASTDPIVPFLAASDQLNWAGILGLLAALNMQALAELEKTLYADLLLRQQAILQLQINLAQELFYFGRPMFQVFNHPDLVLTMEDGVPRLRLI